MTKHPNIPTQATWNEESKEWTVAGSTNEAGQRTGLWENWHTDGHRCGITDYGNGTLPFFSKRFHPDGTLAQEGRGMAPQQWFGTYRWIKSNNPTSELFPFPAKDIDIIWSAEFDYTEAPDNIFQAQRYYDRANNEIMLTGEPMPSRPKAVPTQAHPIKYISNEVAWVACLINGTNGKFVGDYAEWDQSGVLLSKRVYNTETGELVEKHEYSDGRLSSSSIYTTPGDLVLYFYDRKSEKPRVTSATQYRNNQKDRTTTLFDEEGNVLYTYRMETISDRIVKRYYNDLLVYEGITSEDKTQKPSTYTYYHPNGAVLIDYTSHGDNTGLWRMYDENGNEILSLKEADEADMEEHGEGKKFVRTLREYKHDTKENDWQAIVNRFKRAYKDSLTDKKIATLPVPAYLQTELAKVDWASVGYAMYSANELPWAINAVLSDDEAVAKEGLSRIWLECEHQGSVYECTYEVAIILARMLPHYAGHATIQPRLLYFLYRVLRQPQIKGYDNYGNLIDAIQPSLPVIQQQAMEVDDIIAIEAQFILLEAGYSHKETEEFFITEWHDNGNPLLRRAYAALALGYVYLYSEKPDLIISTFAAALPNEKESLVRLMLACHLVATAKHNAEDAWIAELLPVLYHPGDVSVEFYELHPFLTGYDPDQYVLMILEFAKPEVLERNIEPVINILSESDIFKQESLLRAIFIVLFAAEDALTNINPIRQKALLAAAEVVSDHPTLVNHHQIFREFNLPYNSEALRELAASGKSLATYKAKKP